MRKLFPIDIFVLFGFSSFLLADAGIYGPTKFCPPLGACYMPNKLKDHCSECVLVEKDIYAEQGICGNGGSYTRIGPEYQVRFSESCSYSATVHGREKDEITWFENCPNGYPENKSKLTCDILGFNSCDSCDVRIQDDKLNVYCSGVKSCTGAVSDNGSILFNCEQCPISSCTGICSALVESNSELTGSFTLRQQWGGSVKCLNSISEFIPLDKTTKKEGL